METLSIGEYVVNQNTNHLGKVIGYGHQIKDGSYLPTLKVLIENSENVKRRGFVEEDLYSNWSLWKAAVK